MGLFFLFPGETMAKEKPERENVQSEKDAKIASEVIKQFAAMQEAREPWAAAVKTAVDLVDPTYSSMTVDTQPDSFTIDTEARDGQAIYSAGLMSDGLLGNVCGQGSKWFSLVPEKPSDLDIPNVGKWLDAISGVFYHILATSSFYQAAWQCFYNGALSGLGPMMMQENLKEYTVDFQAYSVKGAHIATNFANKTDTYFRHFTRQARQIVREYGEGNLPKQFIEDAKKKPFQRHELIHAIFPRYDRDIYKIDAINKPWASIHVMKAGKWLMKNSGYDSFPMSIWRYKYGSEDTYPHSPTIDGYPDIARLNGISKDVTDISGLLAKPPYMVPGEIFNDFKLQRGYKMKALDMSRKPEGINVGQNYPVGRDREEYYRQMVREKYHTDFFLMMAAADGQNMTATEVLERQGEKATVIGGMIGRLTTEFLDPIFERLFIIAARNKWIPEPPEELLAKGGGISIDYLGPLAQAQKRYLKTQGPLQAMQNVFPMMEAYPQMRHLIDEYKLGRQLLVEGGMPNDFVRDEKQYRSIVDQENQAMAQAQQAETMEKEAGALNKAGKAPESGSAAEAMLNG